VRRFRDRDLRRELEQQVELLHGADDSSQSINLGDAKGMLIKHEQALSEEANRHRREKFAWEEERARLKTLVNSLETDQFALEEERKRLEDELAAKVDELTMLKAEVESQWQSAERNTDALQELEAERNALQEELAKVEEELGEHQNRLREMEEEYVKVVEEKEDLEREHNEVRSISSVRDVSSELMNSLRQIVKDLQSEQQRTSELVISLRESEAKTAAFSEERQYTKGNAVRLNGQIRQRDAEIAECRSRILEREQEAEALREQLSQYKRESTRVAEEQARFVAEATRREAELTSQMEELLKEKAESGVEAGQVRERSLMLKEEMERLRRQVHALQQESANKEMQVVSLTKSKEQADEDKHNLELELVSVQFGCGNHHAADFFVGQMKRNMGVKGLAGSTPAPSARTGIKPRDSNIMDTPSLGSRPPPQASDSGRESVAQGKLLDSPRAAIKATSALAGARAQIRRSNLRRRCVRVRVLPQRSLVRQWGRLPLR
jgi:chromosome segregation ATPase